MKPHQYAWNLYKNSPEGKNMIKFFSEANGYILFKKYCPHAVFHTEEEYDEWLDNIYCYGVSEYEQPASLDDAKNLYSSLITLGFMIEGEPWIYRNDFKRTLGIIQPISYVLSRFAPEYFFPYLFICRISELNRISDVFDIELPKLPKRTDYKGRCMYYWEMCELFYTFRKDNGLSSAELCAFLYDFSSKVIGYIPFGENPQPSQAWFIGGLLYPKDKTLDAKFWQSSPETKKGDILIHYETSPISAITCIEIAQTDGVIDPLFYYYSNTYIGERIDIPHVTLKELQYDAYFSKHPLVRKRFQGVNGRPASDEDYAELIRLIKTKGFDVEKLPKLYAPTFPKDIIIENEKDVEKRLLEPILNAMGWYEHKDFIRQLSIHAGRGHRIFPDYALHYDNKPEEERASVLIEAKLYMKSNRDIEEAFLQARSYAQLLSSSVIVLCDKLCLFIYEKNGSFDRNNYKRYYWTELEHPEIFNELKNKLNN